MSTAATCSRGFKIHFFKRGKKEMAKAILSEKVYPNPFNPPDNSTSKFR